jgi:outer membrane protein
MGVGAGFFSLPQYVGSNERTRAALPIPYFVYRGEKVSISRDSLSGRYFIRADLVLDFSGDFSLPVDSNDNDARAGMPDIDFLFEVGPSLRYIFLRNTGNRRTLSIELPVRAVLQSDLRYLGFEGWRVNPRLRYKEYFGPWKLSFWGGVYWNDQRYNNLVYGVSEEFATNDRPAYNANSGYGGWAASASLGYRHKAWWVSGFFRVYDVNNASFASSPLTVKQANIGFGLAAAWIFKTSDRTVSRWTTP